MPNEVETEKKKKKLFKEQNYEMIFSESKINGKNYISA